MTGGNETVHLLLKWRPVDGIDTIGEHRAIADSAGSVWWGKFAADPTKKSMADHRLERFSHQLSNEVPTHVYIVGADSVFRTHLNKISLDSSAVDEARKPKYYASSECNLFVELGGFEQLDRGWIEENLVLQSNPNGLIKQSLQGQSSLLYVLEQPGPSSETFGPTPITMLGSSGVLDQDMTMETGTDTVMFTIESAGGDRNTDYDLALETLLLRAGLEGWTLVEVLLASATVRDLPSSERRLLPQTSVDLRAPSEARRKIQAAAAEAHRRPAARGGGNPQKRLELVFSVDDIDAGEPELAISADAGSSSDTPPPNYDANVMITVADGKPGAASSRALELAWRQHNQLQQLLVDSVKASPSANLAHVEANVDVAWSTAGFTGVTIAEVKSLTAGNERFQIRMAIGEVLHFAEVARGQYGDVRTVIFVPRRPNETIFMDVCERVGIDLCWPTQMPSDLSGAL